MSILSEVGAILREKFLEHKALIDTKLDAQSTQDIEITDSTKGIILKSPSGKRFRITVNDDGNLVKQEVDGDNNGIGDMTIGEDFIIQ
jgi:hypothetical protein|tara:strand:+ start:888 stop:1151 length:264 start_codon:yes stop_codon:yes gene_type:complete